MTNFTRLTILFCTAFLLPLYPAAHASPAPRRQWLSAASPVSAASQARKEIASEILSFRAAIDREDFDAAISLCTPDFVMILANGQTYGRDDLRQALERFKTHVHSKSSAPHIAYFHYTPQEVSEINISHIFVPVLNNATQRYESIDIISSNSDLWKKTAWGWRLRFSRNTFAPSRQS